MAFDIGGIAEGVKKGMNYDKQFMAAFVAALKRKNWEQLEALGGVAVQNLKEFGEEAKDLSTEQAVSILVHPDPFAGSRHLFQQFQMKYGKK